VKKFNLTQKGLDGLTAPPKKQVLYWVRDLKGLAVLVSGSTLTKTYVVQKRNQRITVGRVAEFEARAREALISLAVAETAIAEAEAAGDPVKAARAREAKANALRISNPIEAARDEASDRLKDLRQGRDGKARKGGVTLQEALDDFCTTNAEVADRTKEFYRSTIKNHYGDWLEKTGADKKVIPSRMLSDITPKEIRERTGKILETVAANRLKQKTLLGAKSSDVFINAPGVVMSNIAFRTFRSIWRYAAQFNEGVPKWDSDAFKKTLTHVKSREAHIDSDHIKGFYEAVNAVDGKGDYLVGRANRDYILLSLFCGFRKSDALGLRWEQVEFNARIIRRSITETKGQKTALVIPMSDYVFDLLSARKALGVESDFVFPSEAKSGHLEHPRQAFRNIAKRCGFRIHPHGLRHTFISISDLAAISGNQQKALVGHTKGRDVTANYAHVSTHDLRGAAQAVTDKILELVGASRPKVKMKLA